MVALGKYSIKDIEALSGIKAHTIRIWEQRYSLIKPKRTSTNIRYYDDEDLKYILNVSLLNNYGYKISRIAGMNREELHNKVVELSGENLEQAPQMQALIYTMLDMDEPGFERVLSTNIIQQGLENTMLELVYPLLYRVGILWQTGAINPAHEHFISNLVRQKLIVAIDGQVPAGPGNKPSFLLYLPEGELHEIGLLFADFILRSRGYPVIYLGQNLPFSDLVEGTKVRYPDYFLTVFTVAYAADDILAHIKRLAGEFPDCTILAGGSPAQCVQDQLPENAVFLSDITSLTHFLDQE